jgi:excisionase family DNA binding protein
VLISFELDRRTAGAIVVAAHLLRPFLAELLEQAGRVVTSEQEHALANTDLPAAATSTTVDSDGRDYLTPAEYAELMGVHVSTVRRWVRSGELSAERRGRTARIPNPRRK